MVYLGWPLDRDLQLRPVSCAPSLPRPRRIHPGRTSILKGLAFRLATSSNL